MITLIVYFSVLFAYSLCADVLPHAGISCYMPANGETTTVVTNPNVPVDISLNLLKREMALGGAD